MHDDYKPLGTPEAVTLEPCPLCAIDADPRQVDDASMELGRLLNHIHGDSGQYVAVQGWKKAAADALARLSTDGVPPAQGPSLHQRAGIDAALDALNELFRENAIPMSDRNARLHDRIEKALTYGVTEREFTNEIGNRIRITIEGPTSTSENVLTPMEAGELRQALNAHGVSLADAESKRHQPPMPSPLGEG